MSRNTGAKNHEDSWTIIIATVSYSEVTNIFL